MWDSLAKIAKENSKLTVVRPSVPTTADRLLHGGLSDGVVLFDWQQNWSQVKALLARNDVKWAALQGVRGRMHSRYHGSMPGEGYPEDDWPPGTSQDFK
jgi:hypothetical protein